jgi:MFS family permease
MSTSFERYRAVLRIPGIAVLLGFAVFARIPQTASGVVFTLYVVGRLGRGYGAAGLVVAAATAGLAASGPWRGRAIDRRGLRRALIPSVIGSAVSWGIAPFVGFVPLAVVALVGGALSVPIFGVLRQSLSVLAPPQHRRTAFALDSIGTEVSFMIGPAAGVLLATQWSATAALVAVGVGTVLSGLGLIVLDPPTRSRDPEAVEAPAPGVAAGGVAGDSGAAGADPGTVGAVVGVGVSERGRVHWYTPGLLAVLAAAFAAGVVLAGTDVALVAQLRAAGALSLTWLVFLAWSGGSVVGGAVYGGMHRSVSPTVLLLGLALLTVPVGFAPSPALLAVTILPAAALCAPLISSTAEAVSRLVPEGSRGEAMGWHGSSLTIGSALGAPLSGAVIDGVATWAGFAAVGAVGGALAGFGLLLLIRPGRSSGTEAEVGKAPGVVTSTRREPGLDQDAERPVPTW